jgi:hypothetical protein
MAEYQLRLSAFRLRHFRSFFFPFVIRAEAALCDCFHRHLPAATRHGAPNQIGGDGSKQ